MGLATFESSPQSAEALRSSKDRNGEVRRTAMGDDLARLAKVSMLQCARTCEAAIFWDG